MTSETPSLGHLVQNTSQMIDRYALDLKVHELLSDRSKYVLSYSSNIERAFQIVRVMERQGYWCRIDSPFYPGSRWRVGFTPHNTSGFNGSMDHVGIADTLPLAMCLAFLQYHGQTLPYISAGTSFRHVE